MTERQAKNIVASIHQRLLNASKQTGRAFNDLVLYYAIERFLYRLSLSPYADRFILKGGLMLNVWNAPLTRVTRDIDLLGKLDNTPDRIAEVVRAVCDVDAANDALIFKPETVVVRAIAEDADYEGVRATFKGYLGKVPLAMQIDFGFSDVITPAPAHIAYPSVLGHSPPQLMAYNRETAVAEKFQAMVKHGELNSRMRDFFDVWVLAKNFGFDGRLLTDAIRATFARRHTDIEINPVCFSENFTAAPTKVTQWKGFLKNSRVTSAPKDFVEVVDYVRQFLQPVAQSIADNGTIQRQWPAGGPWQ